MAAAWKNTKYTQIAMVHHFVPLAFETMGPVNADGLAFISALGQALSTMNDDARETSYLHQRISIMIQRFNAVAFRGAFPAQVLNDD
jgi:hypothetical protein